MAHNLGMAINQEIADQVLARLREGLSLRKACAAVDGAKPMTILDWTDAHPEFGVRYARAREVGYKLLADEILQISDDGKNDSYIDADGVMVTDQDVIARSRLRVDSRKWLLSKMLPKTYGDFARTELSGPDGGAIPIIDAGRPKLSKAEWLATHGIKELPNG